MHNPTTYHAIFNRLRMHAFGKQQTLAYRGEVTIYQSSHSPERWRARPAFETGRHKWEASSAGALMQIIQDDFETQLTEWIPKRASGPLLPRPQPQNVVWIDAKRRA